MPLYEYQCLACNKSFSLLQKVGATEKDTTCPHCGSRDLRKLFSTFSCCSGTPSLGASSGSSGGT
ncbi:MAG TPA: zinc ribbon domain-containing protein [Nitrospirae bacterium]|nr:zinc ribbon domain-containing protein [Nitrospirota bacterium]